MGQVLESQGVLIEYAQYAHILKKTPFFRRNRLISISRVGKFPQKTKPGQIPSSDSFPAIVLGWKRAVRELSVTGAPGGDTADAPRELSENAAIAYASEPGATPGIGECVAAGISAPNFTARFSSIQS